MPMFTRQQQDPTAKAVSARVPEERYEKLVDFALTRRFTLTMAVNHLLDKALNAENGTPYVPTTVKFNA